MLQANINKIDCIGFCSKYQYNSHQLHFLFYHYIHYCFVFFAGSYLIFYIIFFSPVNINPQFQFTCACLVVHNTDISVGLEKHRKMSLTASLFFKKRKKNPNACVSNRWLYVSSCIIPRVSAALRQDKSVDCLYREPIYFTLTTKSQS